MQVPLQADFIIFHDNQVPMNVSPGIPLACPEEMFTSDRPENNVEETV